MGFAEFLPNSGEKTPQRKLCFPCRACFLPPAFCSLFLLLFILLPDLKLRHPQVNLAYEAVKEVDVLGSEAWEAAMERYDEKIDRVETRITTRLR